MLVKIFKPIWKLWRWQASLKQVSAFSASSKLFLACLLIRSVTGDICKRGRKYSKQRVWICLIPRSHANYTHCVATSWNQVEVRNTWKDLWGRCHVLLGGFFRQRVGLCSPSTRNWKLVESLPFWPRKNFTHNAKNRFIGPKKTDGIGGALLRPFTKSIFSGNLLSDIVEKIRQTVLNLFLKWSRFFQGTEGRNQRK